MTPPPELENSGLYAKATKEFDAAVDAITAAVAPLASQQVREQLDEFKRTTHALHDALRRQLIDDATAVLSTTGPALSAELRKFEQRLRNLELLAQGHASDSVDDPTGYDAGRR